MLLKFKQNKYENAGYFAHRALVLTISFLTIQDIYIKSNNIYLTAFLILLILVFQFTYKKLPGKNYPSLKELISK